MQYSHPWRIDQWWHSLNSTFIPLKPIMQFNIESCYYSVYMQVLAVTSLLYPVFFYASGCPFHSVNSLHIAYIITQPLNLFQVRKQTPLTSENQRPPGKSFPVDHLTAVWLKWKESPSLSVIVLERQASCVLKDCDASLKDLRCPAAAADSLSDCSELFTAEACGRTKDFSAI